LVRISKKHDIDTFKFLRAIHRAWIKGESFCDGTHVTWRQLTEGIATFLITTRDHEIVAQVRLTSRVLGYMAHPELLNLRFTGFSPPKWKASQAKDLEIKDLNAGIKRFNLDAKVTDKSSARTVMSRWGEALLLSTATIMDASGTIRLPLWKDQISMISVGDRIHVENARLKRFRGEFQVRVDKLARLSVIGNHENEKRLTTKT
jgi:replication factor A1